MSILTPEQHRRLEAVLPECTCGQDLTGIYDQYIRTVDINPGVSAGDILDSINPDLKICCRVKIFRPVRLPPSLLVYMPPGVDYIVNKDGNIPIHYIETIRDIMDLRSKYYQDVSVDTNKYTDEKLQSIKRTIQAREQQEQLVKNILSGIRPNVKEGEVGEGEEEESL